MSSLMGKIAIMPSPIILITSPPCSRTAPPTAS
jgi:hypothetical protein